MRVISFAKETTTDAFHIITSRDRLRETFGVSLYRNSVYLMLNNGINAAAGLLFWVMATRVLEYGKENVGLAAATISAVTLLGMISVLGLNSGLIKFLPGSGDRGKDMINTCFTLGSIFSLVVALVFLGGVTMGVWFGRADYLQHNASYLVLFILFTAGSTLQTLSNYTFIARRRSGFALAQGVIFNSVRFLPLLLLASFAGAFGIFAGWGAGVLVSVAVSVALFVPLVEGGHRPVPAVSKAAMRELVPFSLRNYVADLLWAAPALILPIMVVEGLDAASNADWYIGYMVSSILFIIPMVTALSLFAEASHEERSLRSHVNRSMKLILVMLVPAALSLFLLGSKVLFLFGEDYSENATWIVRVLALAVFPLSINYLYLGVRRAKKELGGAILLAAFTALGTLSLSWFLLPRIGVTGAAISWLAVQSIAAVFAMRYLLALTGERVAADHMESNIGPQMG